MQISWNLVTFRKIYLKLVFWFFFFSNFKLILPALFHDQVLFICMSFIRKINISLTILVVFESIKFRKNLNNTFPIETGIINLFHYICGIWFIHKNTYLQWQSWNMMMSSKNWSWLLFRCSLKDLMQYHTHAKFHSMT